MSALPEESRQNSLLQAKRLLQAALDILDRTQNWAIGAPIASAITSIDEILDANDTVH